MLQSIKLLLFLILVVQSLLFAQSYELEKIEFSGNKEISSDELMAVIYSEETPWWFYQFLNSFSSMGKGPVYFDSSYIPIDMNAMKAYYSSHGFFKTTISYSYEADTTDHTVVLKYEITENEPAMYGNVNFLGLKEIPENILNRIYAEDKIDRTIPYNQADVEAGIAHTIEILVNRGYMFANHDSTVIIIDTTQNLANVDIYYSTGNRYQISDVQVVKKGSGADDVSEELLRELTDIEKDEYYNLEKIRSSQSRLIRTGLFNSLILDAVKKDTSGNYVPLMVEGNIGNMNEFLPGVLVNDEFNALNVGLNANYIRKNFLGNARKLTLANEIAVADIVDFSFKEFFSDINYVIDGYARVSLKLEQPFLFHQPINGTLENYFQTQTEFGLNRKLYGLKAALEFELPYFTYINQFKPYYNLEFLNYKFNNIPFEEVNLENITVDILSATSALGMQLGSAKANNLYFPTGGMNQLLQMEVAISTVNLTFRGPSIDELVDSGKIPNPSVFDLKDDAMFYKIEYTSALYFPLSNDLTTVFAVKNKIGHVQTFKGDESLIPLNKTFYSGGGSSNRGWRSKALYPRQDIEYWDFSETPDTLRGGTFLYEGSLEYRKRFLESLGVAVFADYGNVWNGYGKFRFDEIAIALGFGFRYYSSIAPFRIDFGFKFYDPYQKKYIWDNWDKRFFKNFEFHFGIGEAF